MVRLEPVQTSLALSSTFFLGQFGAACVQGSAPCQRKHWSCEVLTPPFQIGGAAVRRVTVRECCGTVWSWKSSGSPESRCSLEEQPEFPSSSWRCCLEATWSRLSACWEVMK